MDVLRTIADNPALMEALRGVLLKQFDTKSITGNLDTTTDTLLGQQTRARLIGMVAIEAAMREIAAYQSPSQKPTSLNPAR